MLFIIGNITADEISFSLEIHGISINDGTIYGAIYSNNSSYKNNQPEYTFMGNPINDTINISLQIPEGEYVIQVYQDTNNNNQLDFGLFGIPKEPVGITNWNGKGIPGNFTKQKNNNNYRNKNYHPNIPKVKNEKIPTCFFNTMFRNINYRFSFFSK
jgi:uncharacterized protein (DUF2141 family)